MKIVTDYPTEKVTNVVILNESSGKVVTRPWGDKNSQTFTDEHGNVASPEQPENRAVIYLENTAEISKFFKFMEHLSSIPAEYVDLTGAKAAQETTYDGKPIKED